MDKLIDSIKTMKGYTMSNNQINIVGYADDVVLIAESEDDLQRLLHKFVMTSKLYNMVVSTEKTKTMVISKEPSRCKLEIEGTIIE